MKSYDFTFCRFALLLAYLSAAGCFSSIADTPTATAVMPTAPTYTPAVAPTSLPFTGRIAFVHWDGDDDKDIDIYVMNADGSGLQYLTKSHLSHTLVWSPDGQRISFISVTDGTQQIYTINADGSRLKQLTFGKSPSSDPAWSPDGKYIAFSSIVLTSPTEGGNQIFIMKADGSDLRQLTFDEARPYATNSYRPAWSSDGKYILFKSNRYEVLDDYGYPEQTAYVMNSDGSEQRPLANHFVNSVSWYPKDNLISVSVPESRYTFTTYIVNVDGVIQSQFPKFETGGTPDWSSSGELVLYRYMRVLEPALCSNIDVMKPDSVNSCFEIDGMPPSVYAISPSWSPDGKHVIFSSNLDGDYDLYIIKPDGSGLTQLTNMPGDEGSATWWLVP